MVNMRFDEIKSKSTELSIRLNSYQFKLSQKIFGKRINLNLDRNEAAKLVGLSEERYTKFEQGIDLDSSKKEYEEVLHKLTHLNQLSESQNSYYSIHIKNEKPRRIPEKFVSITTYTLKN